MKNLNHLTINISVNISAADKWEGNANLTLILTPEQAQLLAEFPDPELMTALVRNALVRFQANNNRPQ